MRIPPELKQVRIIPSIEDPRRGLHSYEPMVEDWAINLEPGFITLIHSEEIEHIPIHCVRSFIVPRAK